MKLIRSCLPLAAFIVAVSAAALPARAEVKDIVVATASPSVIPALPITVAIGEGYFQQEGLNVRIEGLNGSSAVLQAMTSGQAHVGNPGAGPFLAARLRGIDATFIYRLNPNSSYGIVVQEASPAQTVADLKGSVIGVGTADGAETAFARSILTEAGLKEGADYTFLVVGDGGMAAAAFARQDVGAYVAATADSAILNTRGFALRNITPDKYRVFFGNGLAVMTDFLKENPETIAAFGRAVVKGARFAADPANVDKVLAHVVAINPQEGEDSAFATALIRQIIVRQTPFDLSKGYGYQDHAAWQAWQDSLVASGDLAQPLPDLKAVYTNDFVPDWNSQ